MNKFLEVHTHRRTHTHEHSRMKRHTGAQANVAKKCVCVANEKGMFFGDDDDDGDDYEDDVVAK